MSEERITELELRYTLQQDLLQQLSDVVLRHQQELDRLRRELDLLRTSRDEAPIPLNAEEPPPHY